MDKRKLYLWRGYHGLEIERWIQLVWNSEADCLLLFPPRKISLNFLKYFGGYEIAYIGDWEGFEKINMGVESQVCSFEKSVPPKFGIFSTGTEHSKLVLLTKQNLEHNLKGILSFFDLSRYQSIFCYPQPFHIFGLSLGYVQALVYKKQLVRACGPYGSNFHELWFQRNSGDCMTLGTPTHFFDLYQYSVRSEKKCDRTYTCIVGGAAVTKDAWLMLRNALQIQEPSVGYGATESSPGVTHLPPGQEPIVDYEVGFPLPNLDVRILPDGVEVHGGSVCLAIIEDSEPYFLNKLVIADQLVRTSKGTYQYQGRLDDLLNRGGEKFSLLSIERALSQLLETTIVCVKLNDMRLQEDLGIIVYSEPCELKRTKILNYLEAQYCGRLGRTSIKFVSEMPLNSSGKLDRKLLKNNFNLYV